jgi:hypothetical protein
MVQEIGSEFWDSELNQLNKININEQHQYLLTGRTAIDYIIKNIKNTLKFNVVYLPDYCCHSMIQPFLDNRIAVEFYNVNFQNGKYTYDIDFDTQCDAILIMEYFGFSNETVGQIINRFKELDKIIIEDATHSWLSDTPYNSKSDYVFASFRKWTGLACGAIAIKKDGDFLYQISGVTNTKYVQLRKEAANLKRDYIRKGIGQKETFLKIFNQAESLLEQDYQEYSIPLELEEIIKSLDQNEIRHKRKINADYLIHELQNFNALETIIQTKKDIPLFVPIIVQNGKRDKLRQYLIENDIYCPVHWPVSNEHRLDNKLLYENSLSLICDQRYTLTDMKRIIETINRFYGG